MVLAKTPYGSVREVSEEELAGGSYVVLSPEEAEAYAREQRTGGVLGTIASTTTGALRGATLGASDVLISELGGREGLQELKEVNPTASTIGEIGGGLAGLGKGRGALGLLSAPARLATRTGAAVERAAIGSPLLGAVARAATEGSIYGTGVAISESALQNKALTAEQLATHAFQGGVLGAGIAGGLGALGKGAASIADRVRSKVTAEGVERMTGEGFGHRVVGAWDKAAARLGGAPEGAVESMFSRGKSGKLGFEAALGADDILEQSADDFTESLRGVLKTKGKLEARFKGALKEDQIARIVKRGAENEIRGSSQLVLDDLAMRVDDMITRELEFGSRGALKKLRKKIDQVNAKIATAGDDAVPERAFMQLDTLKRDVGKITRKARGKVDRGGLSEDIATYQRLDEAYERLRGHLELDSLWGDAAVMQKRINAPWAANIGTNRDFHRLFSNPQQGRFGARYYEASRDKVGSFVSSLTNPNKSDAMQALTAQLDSLESFAKTADEVMHLPPAERAAVKELGAQVAAMRGKLDEAAEAITARNQLKSLEEAGQDSAGALGTMGAILGGAPGAAVGKALEVVMRPGQTVRQLAALHSLIAKNETRGAKALARLTAGSLPKVALAGGRAGPRAVQPETRDRFEARKAAAEQAQRAPEQAREQLYASMGDLVIGAPDTAARAAEQALAASQYLGKQLPEGATPTPAEMKRWLEISDALGDPTTVLEDAAGGRVKTHQVHAIRDVYPEIYQQMQMDIADELAAIEADGRRLPYAHRVALGVAFGLDTDPMLQITASLQEGYAAAAPEEPPVAPPPQGGPAPDVSDSLMTGPERRAMEG